MEGATTDTEQDVPSGAIAEEELERKRKGYCSVTWARLESPIALILLIVCVTFLQPLPIWSNKNIHVFVPYLLPSDQQYSCTSSIKGVLAPVWNGREQVIYIIIKSVHFVQILKFDTNTPGRQRKMALAIQSMVHKNFRPTCIFYIYIGLPLAENSKIFRY